MNKPKYLFELIVKDMPISVIAASINNAKEKLEREILLPKNQLSPIYIEKIIALLPSRLTVAKQLELKNANG